MSTIIFLKTTSHYSNLVIIVALTGIVLLIVLFNFIRKITSEPLENEELKREYLEGRFNYELEKPLKDDEYSAKLRVDRPYTRKKEWYVWKITDRGYQGAGSFKSQEKYYKLFKIFDYELDEIIKSDFTKGKNIE